MTAATPSPHPRARASGHRAPHRRTGSSVWPSGGSTRRWRSVPSKAEVKPMCASGYPPLVDPKSHPYYVPPRDPAEGDISAGMVGRMDVEHAPWSLLMGTMYFEDLNVGDSWTSAEHRVDHEEMLAYNRTNDPWPIHIDPAEAARSPFGRLIASGGYTISLMYRLSHQIVNQPDRAWAFLGGFDWHVKFVEPVRSGDRLHERITIWRNACRASRAEASSSISSK